MSRYFTSRRPSISSIMYAEPQRPPNPRILTNTSTCTPHPFVSSASPESIRRHWGDAREVEVTISRAQSPATKGVAFKKDEDEMGEAEDDGEQIRFRAPVRGRTQEEQDKEDDTARKKAMKELVQSWMDRLQLISLITTFFAATEAQLLGSTTPTGDGPVSRTLVASNAGLVGALVVHVFAAIVSFLAAFVLIRYKLKEATVAELTAEGFPLASPGAAEAQQPPSDSSPQTHPLSRTPSRPAPVPNGKPEDRENTSTLKNASSNLRRLELDLPLPPIVARNPHLEQVGPFRSRLPPTHMLERAHTLCVALSVVGFVLAMLGIVCYAWAVQPRTVGVVASAGTAVGVFGGVAMFFDF